MFGGTGSPSFLSATESYDGTSYTTSPASLASGRNNLGGDGGNNAYLAVGGNVSGPAKTSNTEEYNQSSDVVTAAAFSGGGNMNTARRAMAGGAGTSTAGMVGGYITANSNATEEYDGSAWANGGNLPVALYYITVAGTQTAGLAVGGGDPVVAEGIEYDGSSWTDIGNAPASVKMAARAGTQTAALLAGGNDSSNNAVAKSFTYNGSSFSNITDMPSARGSGHVGGGSQTASVHAAGSLGLQDMLLQLLSGMDLHGLQVEIINTWSKSNVFKPIRLRSTCRWGLFSFDDCHNKSDFRI